MEQWLALMKFTQRRVIENTIAKSINHFKDSFCIASRKTQNEKTLHANLLRKRQIRRCIEISGYCL